MNELGQRVIGTWYILAEYIFDRLNEHDPKLLNSWISEFYGVEEE